METRYGLYEVQNVVSMWINADVYCKLTLLGGGMFKFYVWTILFALPGLRSNLGYMFH